MAVPDKRYTFDKNRPVTTIEHILADYAQGPDSSRRQHLEEWFRIIGGVQDKDTLETLIAGASNTDLHVHWHVWTSRELIEFIAVLRRFSDFDLELAVKNEDELIFVLRKIPSLVLENSSG